MTGLAHRNALTVLGVILCFFSQSACFAAADADSLDARPWVVIVDPAKQTLPGIRLNGSLTDISPEDFAKLPKMAEEGVTFAAVMLARLYQHEFKDMDVAVRWLRKAVENGDVDSAMILGSLYFPLEGTLGREKFTHAPDIVQGYVWYAIGLSGMRMLEEQGGKTRMDMGRTREIMEELPMLLLPSERRRVADILSGWPETMPPDKPLELMPTKDKKSGNTGTARMEGWPPDENAVTESIRQWINGETKDITFIETLLRSASEHEQVLKNMFDQARRRAEAGDEEAELIVAWCRFHALGTDDDVALAIPVLEARAEAGHTEAGFLAAAWALENGDRDRAITLASRAAENGHTHAMLLMSQIMRDKGDKKEAGRWMEKAAETGSFSAIEEMLGFAESTGNWEKLVHWLTVLTIRAPDPAMSYRCRMLIVYSAGDMDREKLRAAMAEGEKWHNEHPVLP